MLHSEVQCPMTSCSKGAWGLFVLSRGLGILTETAISPSTWSRQCPSRYAIRAGRNLPDKEFRYLRTVIVTAAVYRGFGSRRRPCGLTSPLNLPAPGRRQCVYGALCGLARTCVFAKQSLGPILCGLPPRRPRGALQREASLLPKLRDQYAEFLDHVSLVHLRLLASPTCVGLRYGRPAAPHQAFLARRLYVARIGRSLPSPSVLGPKTYDLRRSVHKTADASFRCPSMVRHCRTGPECQPAVHRLRLWGLALGSASPCADCHGAGTLGFTVSVVFTQICAYSFRHPHFLPLQANVSTGPSLLQERSPTPQTRSEGQASAGRLIPTILGASALDQ